MGTGEKYTSTIHTLPSSQVLRTDPLSVATEEQAKHILGSDYIGRDDLREIEQLSQVAGVRALQFFSVGIRQPRIGQLEEIAAQKGTDRESTCFIQPNMMRYLKVEPTGVYNWQCGPITLAKLWDAFEYANPFGIKQFFYNVSDGPDWTGDDFLKKDELPSGYAITTKNALKDSLNKALTDQQKLLESGERTETPVEIVWRMLMASYVAIAPNRQRTAKPKDNQYISSGVSTADGSHVIVIRSDDRIIVAACPPQISAVNMGIHPTKILSS